MFPSALIITAPNWKQPGWPSAGGELKLIYSFRSYYSVVKRNCLLIHTARMKLRNVPSEGSLCRRVCTECLCFHVHFPKILDLENCPMWKITTVLTYVCVCVGGGGHGETGCKGREGTFWSDSHVLRVFVIKTCAFVKTHSMLYLRLMLHHMYILYKITVCKF